MSFLLGLTGSIGMGKSTTTRIFADKGCLTWSADAAVHQLYSTGGIAVVQIKKLFPETVINGEIDRNRLRELTLHNIDYLTKIEKIVHPLVKLNRQDFIKKNNGKILVFDTPLLFEINSQGDFDAVACVSTTFELQKERVLSRPGMTKKIFKTILLKQISSKEKCSRSDYIIDTADIQKAEACVETILKDIERRLKNA